jgi:hypothetical protein
VPTLRMLVKCAMVVPFCLALSAIAQTTDGNRNMKDRILDILFQLPSPTPPFLTQMTLRFGDSDTQLVVFTYPVYPVNPGGRAEIIRYSIAGIGSETLSDFISKMVAQKPDVTAQEIADKLKASVTRSPVDYAVLQHSMKDLETLRISPVLKSRVAVDNYSEYEYWYSNGQEFVHYSITGPFKDATQDQLVEWMSNFRAALPGLAKTSQTRKP